jgi:hypothetical protein
VFAARNRSRSSDASLDSGCVPEEGGGGRMAHAASRRLRPGRWRRPIAPTRALGPRVCFGVAITRGASCDRRSAPGATNCDDETVRVLRPPEHRLLAFAVALVGVAVAAGFAHVPLWQIVALEFLAAGLLALTDRARTRARAQSSYLLSYIGTVEGDTRLEAPLAAGEPIEDAGAPPEPPQVDRARQGATVDQSLGGRPPERGSGPRAAGLLTTSPEQPAEAIPQPRPNLWELDRLAHQQAGDNEEIAFLLFYLRDFADPEGLLPVDFEPLIRETFGSLLAAVA